MWKQFFENRPVGLVGRPDEGVTGVSGAGAATSGETSGDSVWDWTGSWLVSDAGRMQEGAVGKGALRLCKVGTFPEATSSCFEGWPPSPALGENAIRWRRSHWEGKRNRVLGQRGVAPELVTPALLGPAGHAACRSCPSSCPAWGCDPSDCRTESTALPQPSW